MWLTVALGPARGSSMWLEARLEVAHCGWRPGSRWLTVAGGPARGGSLWLEVTRAGSRCLRASWRQVGAVSGAVRGRPGFLSLSVSATRPVTVTVTGFWEQLQSGRAVLRWPSRADRSRRRSRPPAAAQRREIVSSSSSGAGRADHCRHTRGVQKVRGPTMKEQ